MFDQEIVLTISNLKNHSIHIKGARIIFTCVLKRIRRIRKNKKENNSD